MNDTRAWSPETNVVFCAGCRKKVVDLFVDFLGPGKVLLSTNLSLNQMVAVYGSGRGDRVHPGGHELQYSHLSCSILASHTVGSKFEIGVSTFNVLVVGIVEMGVEDLRRRIRMVSHGTKASEWMRLTFSA